MRNTYRVEGRVVRILVPKCFEGKSHQYRPKCFAAPMAIALADASTLPRLLAYPGMFHANRRYLNEEHRVCECSTMAHWLYEAPKGLWIDHINHNPLDNRSQNIRFVSQIQNANNRSNMTFPRHPIRLLRLEREWTQSQLAEVLGTGQPSVQAWENSKRRPSRLYRDKLALLFGVRDADLFPDTTTIVDPLAHLVGTRG